uniref:Uncharacterized protein n=1 Tax=Arundo donax TaxID=35708 RepID=A0A0A9HVR1_ARUDO
MEYLLKSYPWIGARGIQQSTCPDHGFGYWSLLIVLLCLLFLLIHHY